MYNVRIPVLTPDYAPPPPPRFNREGRLRERSHYKLHKQLTLLVKHHDLLSVALAKSSGHPCVAGDLLAIFRLCCPCWARVLLSWLIPQSAALPPEAGMHFHITVWHLTKPITAAVKLGNNPEKPRPSVWKGRTAKAPCPIRFWIMYSGLVGATSSPMKVYCFGSSVVPICEKVICSHVNIVPSTGRKQQYIYIYIHMKCVFVMSIREYIYIYMYIYEWIRIPKQHLHPSTGPAWQSLPRVGAQAIGFRYLMRICRESKAPQGARNVAPRLGLAPRCSLCDTCQRGWVTGRTDEFGCFGAMSC